MPSWEVHLKGDRHWWTIAADSPDAAAEEYVRRWNEVPPKLQPVCMVEVRRANDEQITLFEVHSEVVVNHTAYEVED